MSNIHIFWEDTDKKGIKAKCQFDINTAKYTVIVSKGEHVLQETWEANWKDPRFGMDVVDNTLSGRIAEKLALLIEKKLKEK